MSVTAFAVLLAVLQIESAAWRGLPLKTMPTVAAFAELLIPLLASLIALIAGHPWRCPTRSRGRWE